MKRVVFLLSVIGLVLGFMAFVPAAYAVEGAKDDPDAPHADFEYVALDPLSLPIITARGLTQQVSLMVSLEIDYGQKAAIELYKPRLADAYLQDLYGALGAGHGLLQGNVIDIRNIKQRLSAVTDKVLGPDRKVRGVLLQVVQQRPL